MKVALSLRTTKYIELMKAKALIYCENEFGRIDGKVANGLTRQSETYDIVGVIDSSKAGQDAGEYLDGVKNAIPIFRKYSTCLRRIKHSSKIFYLRYRPTRFLFKR